MTLLKPICRRYLLRLWLFSIAYQAGLISQSSPTLESFPNDSADAYYDADSMSSEIAYLDDSYLDPSAIKYYDPTTGDFSTNPDSYHPPVLRANIRYYDPITGQQVVEQPMETLSYIDSLPYFDHQLDSTLRKRYPKVNIDDIPYYEPEVIENIRTEQPPAVPPSPVVSKEEISKDSESKRLQEMLRLTATQRVCSGYNPNGTIDIYYDSDPAGSEFPYGNSDYECQDPSEIRYYDPTTGSFSTTPHSYQPEINPVDIPYYDPVTRQQVVEKRIDNLPYYDGPIEKVQKKDTLRSDLDHIPYYEPQAYENIKIEQPPAQQVQEIKTGSIIDAGALKIPPEASKGTISNESDTLKGAISNESPEPTPELEKEVLKKNGNRPEDMLAPLPMKGPKKSPPEGTLQSAGNQSARDTTSMKMGQLGSSGSIDTTLAEVEAAERMRKQDPNSNAAKEAEKAAFLSKIRAAVPPPNPKDLEQDKSIAQIQPLPGPPSMRVIAPDSPISPESPFSRILKDPNALKQNPRAVKDISLSFNNVPIIEYIRYISKIAGRNFVFDDEDLQFNITVVSEQMESIDTLMTSLLEELQIRDLSLIEQANNIIIHRNPRVRAPARIVSGGTEPTTGSSSELVTRIFRLKTLDPFKASEVIKPLLSDNASVEVLRDTNKLIVSDLVANVNKIAQLVNTLDAPNSGVQIGQYVVRNSHVDSLVDLATKILQPIAQGNPFILVPHKTSNSIYVVSNEFIVQKTLAILQNLDIHEGKTKVISLEDLKAPGLTSQGAFEKRRVPAVAGGVVSGVVGYEGGAPGFEGEEGGVPPVSVQPGGVVYTGQPPIFPGQPGYPYGQEGEPGEGAYYPGGIYRPGYYPSGMIQSEGQLMNIPGERSGPEGVGRDYPYGFGPGELSSQGYVRGGPPEAFPYGGVVSGGLPGMLEEGRDFLPGGISTRNPLITGLPLGRISQRYFYVHKLRYRQGDQIELALRDIANSLLQTGRAHPELIGAIFSSQWDPSDNSLSFFGTPRALEKIKQLIAEVDIALRQVFIEMLILETDILDQLNLGVDWITSFGGGSTSGSQAFQTESPGVLGQVLSGTNTTVPPTIPVFPPSTLNKFSPGYAGAVIGTHLTHNGTRFSTIGALVQAVHQNTKINIVLNPKIVTEDNNTAEVFVGSVDRYKSQSITNGNATGSLVANNFQFLDVGVTLRVTPLIGNNGLVTLEIVEERSTPNPNANVPPTDTQNDFSLIPVITKERTVTQVHIPNGCFALLSGLMSTQDSRQVQQIPCLGGIPIIGGLCKNKSNLDNKLNVMIFVRPLILETDDDLEEMTKRQQDVWCEKAKFRRAWNFEIDETLDQFNIKPADPDEIGCAGCNQ